MEHCFVLAGVTEHVVSSSRPRAVATNFVLFEFIITTNHDLLLHE